jgi:dTDP-6-deoxy-L-talose 4-dehydrogenase (NAD+)
MNILITGATGFLGKQVLKSLAKESVSIKIISRGNRDNFLTQFKNISEIINTDNFFTESSQWYEEICKDIDIIIHVAWYAEPGKYLESPLNLECLAGTLNFAKSACKQGIKKFVGVGTCFEYDLSNSNPLDINAPLNPKFLYSIAKANVYALLSKYFKNENIEFLWTRVFYLYGEDEDERRLVAVLRKKLALGEIVDLTSGSEIRDFMDVKIAGSMIAGAALGMNVGPFNVCSGEGQSIRELAESIADEYGKRELLNFGAREDNLADSQSIVGLKTKILKTN